MRVFKYLMFLFLIIAAAGCATVTDTLKCVAGVSTNALETWRDEAIKKIFAFDYATTESKVREILKKTGAYIYADVKEKQLIAFYVSEADTTPVGIFLTQIDASDTQIEISSPSTDAKEIIAKRVFNYLEGKIEEKDTKKGELDAKGFFGGK